MNFFIQDIYALDFTQMTLEDSMAVLEFRNHLDVAKWMYSKNISKKSHLKFISELKQNPSNHYWLFKKNQTYLGVGSITRINLTHKHAYLGIYKNPHLLNVGKDILKCLEQIGFKEFKLHSLHLEVIQTNQKAIAFYKKHHYTYEGKLIDFVYQNNNYQNVLIYGKRNPNA
ncbi:UDP-4-amino-4,6-dideoxy-N-acetyl-beta-L-altrosamine N-acetyltransferase [Helicobacter sp. 11S03491-1]|uniref:UDP-4-amino-4, 6-dideoxy-N-acetyl-beta-L-altrosamine N-acetyltransferase n=1 Tax=Helicobacter sp. 11S03491-1 TaxID=1476196 RepID=UPI000BA72984|nr:UDP-4-amino-4,6-dideoxy-N-acetyl-beta-L-altrosamine N-acetyltransferase [Helicobacter sp. 11S03491-1]PAF41152.1 UDP-4-amino-4,6-dideoxy-N-acetyl-beta-L-altrosamine N-acetyltransferase [Helicobacter sp. 11S03491-1]